MTIFNMKANIDVYSESSKSVQENIVQACYNDYFGLMYPGDINTAKINISELNIIKKWAKSLSISEGRLYYIYWCNYFLRQSNELIAKQIERGRIVQIPQELIEREVIKNAGNSD